MIYNSFKIRELMESRVINLRHLKAITPGVIRNFKGEAAVLIEIGFISNKHDLEYDYPFVEIYRFYHENLLNAHGFDANRPQLIYKMLLKGEINKID